MADIKQAAKWMREGKRVRGGNAMYPLFSADQEQIRFMPPSGTDAIYAMDLLDVLAVDWEIVAPVAEAGQKEGEL